MASSRASGGAPIVGRSRLRLARTTVPTNSVTPWLRTRFEVGDGMLRIESPRTILGVLPLGQGRFEVPIIEVERVRVRMVVHPDRAAAAVALGVAAVLLGMTWAAIAPALIGLWLLTLSYVAALEVRTTSGDRHRAGICLFYRFDARLFAAAVTAETPTPAANGQREASLGEPEQGA